MDVSRNRNLRMPKGPSPPYCGDGFGEGRPRQHEYRYEQQQQQAVRGESREKRDFDAEEGYRKPFTRLENGSLAQRPVAQAHHNQRPVQTRAFTERGRYEHQVPNENQPLRDFDGGEEYRTPFTQLENGSLVQRPMDQNNQRPVQTRAFTENGRYEHQVLNENQPLPRKPVQTRGFTESPRTQYQPFSRPENREHVQPPYQHQQSSNQQYQPFAKSPVRDKFSPSNEHHLSSQGQNRYQPFTPVASENYNSMKFPGRERQPAQQPPQGQYESPPPPFQDSQPPQLDSSASSQFKVQRKPLRSYQSSPAVNAWAQQDGILSQDTQKAWDIQAERLLRSNTSNIPPIPQRSWNSQEKELLGLHQSVSNNRTKNAPSVLERPDLSLKTSVPNRMMDSQLYLSPSTAGGLYSTSNSSLTMVSPDTRPSTASSLRNFGESSTSLTTTTTTTNTDTTIIATNTDTTITTTETTTTEQKPSGNAVQNAFREVRHFAGGLIHHPSTSTKHFSILRHSHGLVFYQGPSTSLAISIFASEIMPPARKIYLQEKGWTGKTGMRAAAFFGANNSWIDVTPSLAIASTQLNPRDERAWQRDIASFKKRSTAKIRKRHILRETDVIRIPAEAGDGYFQLVLCSDEKKKVLCTSPTFRLLSLSSSPSSLKGASLSTLPLEMGIMALEVYAKTTTKTVLAPAMAAQKGKVIGKVAGSKAMSKVTMAQKKVEKVTKHVPLGFMQMAENAVEGASGARDKEPGEKGSFVFLGGQALDFNNGPNPPFPIHFTAKSKSGYKLPKEDPDKPDSNKEDSTEEITIPLITISKVPSLISQEVKGGHYFGWTRYKPGSKSEEVVDDDWHKTIISALPPTAELLTRADFRDAAMKIWSAKIMDELDEDLPADTTMEIYIMGFLMPDDPAHREKINAGIPIPAEVKLLQLQKEFGSFSVAQTLLSQIAWSPDAARDCGRAEKVEGFRKVISGVEGAKNVVQGQVSRVDVSRLGVRMEGDLGRDGAVVVNGFLVRR